MSLPPDMLIEREVTAAISAGFPLPRWGWSLPRPYNGFTPSERVLGWQMLRIAHDLGLTTRQPVCSVCNVADPPHSHTEIYSRAILSMAVCRSCHFAIHRRFGDPASWMRFLEDRGARGWATCLRTVELTRVEAAQIAKADDIFGALADDPSDLGN